ncbi:MAG: DNA methyltransferase [Promethearchaeota archaeon]
MNKNITPIDYPIVATPHDQMHVQHKYWSRKPVNVVKAHIEALTKPGDVVLDPFCGAGTSISQAIILGRKPIGFDINPVAVFITKNTLLRADIEKIYNVFKSIEKKIRDKIESLYQTRCPRCLEIDSTETICVHWKVHHPIKVIYTCRNCSQKGKKPKKLTKIPDAEDLTLLEKIQHAEIEDWYPELEIPEGMVFNQARRSARLFSELFTKRNLRALSILYKAINDICSSEGMNADIKNLFLFSFTSMVHLCSKMAPVRPSRPYSSFWATNSYWVPRKFMESNVWLKFESAITGPQGLIASKRDANKKIEKDVKFVNSFSELAAADQPCAWLACMDATNLHSFIPESSVDCIFTDPPYSNIPYSELSMLWASWLKMDGLMDLKNDIVVDPARGKDFKFFQERIELAFKQMYRVLKPGRHLSFTYHNLDIKIRRVIIGAPIKAGFKLESIIYQPPPRTSPAHTLRPFNSAVGDYIVRYRKPMDLEGQMDQETASIEDKKPSKVIEKEIVNLIVKILLERGEPTPFTTIINCLDIELARNNWFFTHDLDLKKILKKYKNLVFIMVRKRIGSKIGYKWWLYPDYIKALKARGEIKDIVPISRRIKAFINENQEIFRRLSIKDAMNEVLMHFGAVIQLVDLKQMKKLIADICSKK